MVIGLDIKSRGLLDKCIGKVIEEIPLAKAQYSQLISQLHIKHEDMEDFVYGWGVGKIEGMFLVHIAYANNRDYLEPEDRRILV
jgi:hypothetical protein